MNEQTQTVTETPTVTTPAAPVETAPVATTDAGAQDDLDVLLKEYDDQIKNAPTETKPPAEPDKEREWLKEQVLSINANQSRERTQKALSDATEEVKKLDGLGHVDPEVLQDLIFARANKDGRFALAVLNGDKKALRSYGKSIESRFQVPDRKLSQDRQAGMDAVRGASLQPPPEVPPNLGAMSDAEFNAYERKLGR